jgi:4-amino-4-deoxy-L-arabinose transferase-like glycosyltransferase
LRQRLTGGSWGIVTVCAVGLAVRLLFATVIVPRLEHRANVGSDPDRYAELAASLLDRGELGFNAPGASPTSLRGPAFPSWLAAGMFAGGRSARWLAFWVSVPGLMAALALVIMLGRSHGRSAGIAAGLLCAAHPLACFVSARVLPDEFYGAFLLLGLMAWQRSMRSVREQHVLAWAALAGVLLSAASLTRVTAVGAVLLLVVTGVLARPRRWLASAVVALVATGLLGAWSWRTSALVGRPAFVESLGGYNFWLGEAADRYGFAADFGGARARAHELMAREAGTQETRSPSFWYGTLSPPDARDFNDRLVGAALRRIVSGPFSYARRCASGFLWFWTRAETASRTMQYAVLSLPLVALSVFGSWRLTRQPHPGTPPAGLVVGIILVHVAIYAAICPMARYSVQVYPLMCYLAGAAFSGGVRQRVAYQQPT